MHLLLSLIQVLTPQCLVQNDKTLLLKRPNQCMLLLTEHRGWLGMLIRSWCFASRGSSVMCGYKKETYVYQAGRSRISVSVTKNAQTSTYDNASRYGRDCIVYST